MRVLDNTELGAVAGGWDDPNTGRDPNSFDIDIAWGSGIGGFYGSGGMFGIDFGDGKKEPPKEKPKPPAESEEDFFERIVKEAMKRLKITAEAEVSVEKKNADGSSTTIKGRIKINN